MSFQPITRNTVSAQIREQLLRMITTGELSPGARVPSERELSEQFEVARTSVRVHQLFETRRVLEVPVFALAAGRSDDASRAAVQDVLDRFEEALTLCEFRQLDREFHTLIASGCGNPLLLELYSKVLDQLFRSWEIDSILTEQRDLYEVEQIIRAAVEGHRVIAEAYCAGDSTAMAAAVEAHLIEIEDSMLAPAAR